MTKTAPTTIRLSITSEVRKALNTAKKQYPALSDPEILKLGLSRIVTDYDELSEVRRAAAYSAGADYLNDTGEEGYTTSTGKKVHFS